MKVHYLQHVPFEGLGYIATWLQDRRHTVTATRFYEPDDHLPPVDAIDALIIMGGPMGVYDEPQYHWLAAEKAFIKACMAAGKAVLGICLGAQLIAACLGAEVHRAPHREIGWFPVMPTAACEQWPWLYQLFAAQPVVFHWHGDQFDIPGEGNANLLDSEGNSNQAFCYDNRVIGLQFHIEVTDAAISAMLEHCAAELTDAPYVQDAAAIREGMTHMAACNALMGKLLQSWLAQA